MIYIFLTVGLVFILVHILNLVLPISGKNNILFGCNVEKEWKEKEPYRNEIKRYRICCNLIFIITFIISLVGMYFEEVELPSIMLIIYGILAAILMGIANKKIKEFKKKEVVDEKREVIVVDLATAHIGIAKIMYYIILSTVTIMFNLWMIIVNYNKLPLKIATHFDFNGVANGWSTKSPGTMALNMFFVIFVLAIYIFSDVILIKTKYKIDPKNREGSLKGNIRMRKLLSLMMAITMLPVVLIATIANLTMLQVLGAEAVTKSTLLMVVVLIGVIGITIVSVKGRNNYGVVNNDVKEKDDDDHWKFGLIYYNKNDSRTFVEKRSGIGVTINAGSKGGMIFFIVMIVVILGGLFI